MYRYTHLFISRVGLWSRQSFLIVFFVSSISSAAPQPNPPPLNEPSETIDEGVAQPVLPTAERSRPFFYRYSAGISPRLGVGNMTDQNVYYSAGLAYMFPRDVNPRDELVLDFLSTSQGQVQYNKRWISDSTSRVRTFTKMGLDLLIYPADGVGNLISPSHYHLRGGIGVERSIMDNLSLRADLEVAIGIKDYQAALIVGYSSGW